VSPAALSRKAGRLETEARECSAQAQGNGVHARVRTHLRKKAERLRAEADGLRRKAAKARGRVQVSDHAVVRYLERRLGLDLDAVRAEIAPPDTHAAVRALGGSGDFPVTGKHGAHTLVVKDHVVVTVLTDA
jgi:hypothetical protein